MKKLFFISIIILSSIAFSFTLNNSWQEYKSIDGVKIFAKTAMCNTEYNTANNEYIVFKYENTNDYNIRISWKLNLWNNGVCRSCDLPSPNEYEQSLDIKAGQTLEYNCSDNSPAFKIFKSSEKGNLHPEVKFELANLKVVKL
jgi:hypothetical protein